jgi:hypothetical protein
MLEHRFALKDGREMIYDAYQQIWMFSGLGPLIGGQILTCV